MQQTNEWQKHQQEFTAKDSIQTFFNAVTVCWWVPPSTLNDIFRQKLSHLIFSSPSAFSPPPRHPFPELSRHIPPLEGCQSRRRTAGLCALHRLLVRLHLATCSVLNYFKHNHKLKCILLLELCQWHSLLVKSKKKTVTYNQCFVQ